MAETAERSSLGSAREGTFHEGLHPLFVTSSAVDNQVIDDFLQSCADNVPVPENYEDLYAFTLQRTHGDAARERDRVAAEGLPMRGTRPPVSPNTTLDFKDATLDSLAHYVLAQFAADEVERQGSDYVQTMSPEAKLQKSITPHIDNSYFVVLDERSAHDKSALLVHLDTQGKGVAVDSPEIRYTRNWIPRSDYTNSANWQHDDVGEEMTAVRLAFKECYRIDMCQLGEEGMEHYAREADHTGVFRGEPAE